MCQENNWSAPHSSAAVKHELVWAKTFWMIKETDCTFSQTIFFFVAVKCKCTYNNSTGFIKV